MRTGEIMRHVFLILLCLVCFHIIRAQSIYSPAQGEVISDTLVNIKYNNPNPGNLIKIQISTDPFFITPVIDSAVLNTDSIHVKLRYNNTYYARIKYTSQNSWSTLRKFHVFSPAATNNLVFNLNANKYTSIDGNGNFIWLSNDPLQRKMYQTASASFPSIDSLTFSFKNIRFDGTNDFLQSDTLFTSPTDYSLVIISNSFNNPSTLKAILGINPYSGANHEGFLHYVYRNSLQNGARVQQSVDGIGSPILELFPNKPFPINNFVISSILVGDSIKYFLQDSLQSFSFPSLQSSFANSYLKFGTFRTPNNDDYFFEGLINSFLLYNKKLTEKERFLSEKYLIQTAIPPLSLGQDLQIHNSFCMKTLDAGARFTQFLWSTGDTSQTISVSKTGTYWVQVLDVFGEKYRDTIEVNYPVIQQITSTTTLCSGTSETWDTGLPKSSYTFQWPDNSTDSTLTISQPGQYWVKITDSLGCFKYSDTITVTVDSFPINTSLPPDTSLCAGNTISLLSGAAQATSYLWSDNSTNDSLTINTTGQYWVQVQNNNGCTARDTINVTISGQAPIPTFSSTLKCVGSPVSFNDASTVSGGSTINSWLWTFGDSLSGANDTSLLQHPAHIFADTGNYTITLLVSTTAGCSQSKQVSIHIAPKPKINFSNGLSCANSTTNFVNNINSQGYPITSYLWNFGDPSSGLQNTSSLNNSSHLYSNSGVFVVKLIALNNQGCTDSMQQSITVNPAVIANFISSGHCLNEPVHFQDNSIAGNGQIAYSWLIDGAGYSGSGTTYKFSQAGNYPVKLLVTAISGCKDDTIRTISIYMPPYMKFLAYDSCKNDTIHLTENCSPQNGNMSSWQWLYDNVIFSNQQSPLLVLTDTGNHHITLIASNTHNCFDTLTKVVRTHPLPLVDFSYSPPTLIYPQTMVQLIPANSTNATFSWNSSSGISSSLPAPVVSFADTGTYTIHLFYADSNGCKGKQQHEIRVLRRYTDMAVLNLFAELQYDSYCKVDAFLANLGSTVVNTFDISLQLTNSGSLKETWTGVLNPGVVIPYHFTAEPFMENTDRIICAEIGKVNLSSDEISANNNYCTVTESGILNVLQPYPNPVSAMLNIPVISDKEQNVNMEIKNILGQSILNPDPIMVAKGLNIMTIDVSALQKACYYLNLSIGTKTFMFKLLKQ